jgi:hypothetical protein
MNPSMADLLRKFYAVGNRKENRESMVKVKELE